MASNPSFISPMNMIAINIPPIIDVFFQTSNLFQKPNFVIEALSSSNCWGDGKDTSSKIEKSSSAIPYFSLISFLVGGIL